MTPERARSLAMIARGKIEAGGNPALERMAAREAVTEQAAGSTVKDVLDRYVELVVRPKLRSAGEIERLLKKYVDPRLGSRPIAEVRRRDIAELLDYIESEHGAVQADRVLAWMRAAFNWWSRRDDDFASPIIRGMARTKPRERARQRVLSDAEIAAMWRAAELVKPAAFGALARLLLLTAARRNELRLARREEINGDVLIVPAARAKGGRVVEIALSADARALLESLPHNGPFIFSAGKATSRRAKFQTDEARPIGALSDGKVALDGFMLDELRKANPKATLERWVIHDLRRTARTLMSRAGVPVDHAERVLSHAIPGVRGVYDVHSYLPEKHRAVEALAAEIRRIVAPTPDGARVVPMRPKGGWAK